MDGTDAQPEQAKLSGGNEPLPRGAAIGRYVVLGLVGRGAMGDVYVAHDPKLARKVAVKLVRARPDSGASDASSRMRLLREAQAIAKLSHPNVVVVHDVGTFRDSVFIAMEFLEGQTVSAWLLAGQRSWSEVLATYLAAGRGLCAAHQAGMVHRDFKPDNVMVGRDGQVRVMDFGLARQVFQGDTADGDGPGPIDLEATAKLPAPGARAAAAADLRRLGDDKLTRTGAMVGTPAYMAPEQFAGHATDARTDQFSFCVALHEGLYGRRPFEADTIVGLTARVLEGRVADAPADTKVPGFVRRILLRGLSPAPDARWPSMEALLAALAHDPVHARRRWLAATGAMLAAAVLLTASAVSGWRASRAARPQLCRAGAEKLAGVWQADAADTPRRARVRAAFLATSRTYAASAFTSVAPILDRYATDWARMYEDACLATHLRGDQSPQALDLRMSCLDDRLGRLQALVDVLSDANPTVVENAAAAASALPALDRCADVKLLRAVMAPPDDPAARARVEVLRRDVARVEAMGNSGQCASGLAAGRKLVDAARALAYPPLAAEALNALARARSDCLDPAEAVDLCKEALRDAVGAHHDEAAVEAALLLARLQADGLYDVRGARDSLEMGRAILRPISDSHPMLEAEALSAEGLLFGREGNHRASLQVFQRSLALQEKALGAEHPALAPTLSNVGAALRELNRAEESVTFFARACRLTVGVLGPAHPRVATYLSNRGESLNALKMYREALDDQRQAVEIWKGAGASAFYVAHGLTRVGESLLGLGRRREAVAALEQALQMHEDNRTRAFPATRFALARALAGAGAGATDQHARAVALAQAAKAEHERTGADPIRIAEIDDWLQEHGAGRP